MYTSINRQPAASPNGVYGFEAIQEFEHDSGLVEGIGYRNGQLVRYTAGSPGSSAFECELISIAQALHWWAQLQVDQNADSTAWSDEPRARFLETAAQCLSR